MIRETSVIMYPVNVPLLLGVFNSVLHISSMSLYKSLISKFYSGFMYVPLFVFCYPCHFCFVLQWGGGEEEMQQGFSLCGVRKETMNAHGYRYSNVDDF